MTTSRVRDLADQQVEKSLLRLRASIEAWAKEREISDYCSVQNYLDRPGAEPLDLPVLAVISFDGELSASMNGYGDEELAISLQDLLADHGCWLEQDKSSTALVFPDEDSDYAAYTSYFHWQWVCGLVEPDTADVYEELYRHFAHRPDDLYRLEWREYETLLARIFQSQGFDVELGPGRGDEGVDIRLIQRDPIGDIVTPCSSQEIRRRQQDRPNPGRSPIWYSAIRGRKLFHVRDNLRVCAGREEVFRPRESPGQAGIEGFEPRC